MVSMRNKKNNPSIFINYSSYPELCHIRGTNFQNFTLRPVPNFQSANFIRFSVISLTSGTKAFESCKHTIMSLTLPRFNVISTCHCPVRGNSVQNNRAIIIRLMSDRISDLAVPIIIGTRFYITGTVWPERVSTSTFLSAWVISRGQQLRILFLLLLSDGVRWESALSRNEFAPLRFLIFQTNMSISPPFSS